MHRPSPIDERSERPPPRCAAGRLAAAHGRRPCRPATDGRRRQCQRGRGRASGGLDARQPGNARLWTIAPAYAPWQGVELGAAWARERGSGLRAASLQAKLQLSAPREGAWHHAVVLGLSHVQEQRGALRYATLIASREFAPGALHLNLGASRAPGGPTLPSLGLAWEQVFGPVTGHLEWLSQRRSTPLFGMGLRREVWEGVQLDGSLGRGGGTTLYSLGMKLQF